MRKTLRNHNKGIFLAVIIFMTASILVAHANTPSYTVEEMVFKTNAVPKTSNDEPIQITSYLYLPKEYDELLPAMVIMSSSGGIETDREIYYAKALVKEGIAALVVDSFQSRGVKDTIYDQSQVEAWHMVNDAFAALKTLAADDRIDATQIGIMGVSKGGTVALDASHNLIRQWAGIKKEKFAAHIAISPDCNWTPRSSLTTGTPVYFMLAELDDQSLVPSCEKKAKRIKAAGNNNVKITIYKGVHHAWEELGNKPVFDPKAENFANCRVWIEDDGSMVSADTGDKIPEDSWYEWANENCKKIGTFCCGGTKEQKQRATKDILDFLFTHFEYEEEGEDDEEEYEGEEDEDSQDDR